MVAVRAWVVHQLGGPEVLKLEAFDQHPVKPRKPKAAKAASTENAAPAKAAAKKTPKAK